MERPHPIKLSFDSSAESLSIVYDANFGGKRPKLTGIESANLKCAGKALRNLAKKSLNGPTIPTTGAGIAVRCGWEGDASVGSIIVHTTRGDEVVSVSRALQASAMISVDIVTSRAVLDRQERRCGDWSGWTTDMDGWRADKGDGRCTRRSDDGQWCKGDAGADIDPAFGGELSALSFGCSGNQGSCEWNDPNAHASFRKKTNGGIHGDTWIGSRSVQLQICAIETTMKNVEESTNSVQSFPVARGESFVVERPKTARGAVLNIKWASGGTNALPAGEATSALHLV